MSVPLPCIVDSIEGKEFKERRGGGQNGTAQTKLPSVDIYTAKGGFETRASPFSVQLIKSKLKAIWVYDHGPGVELDVFSQDWNPCRMIYPPFTCSY